MEFVGRLKKGLQNALTQKFPEKVPFTARLPGLASPNWISMCST